MSPATLLGAVPSPPGNAIALGPLQVRAYGLMIALGAVALVVALSVITIRHHRGCPAPAPAPGHPPVGASR